MPNPCKQSPTLECFSPDECQISPPLAAKVPLWLPWLKRRNTLFQSANASGKLRIVAESYSGRRLGSATARKYGITRSQLVDWRNATRAGRLSAVSPEGFVPVVAEEASPVAGPPLRDAGRMEIVSLNGRRVIVDSGVDVSVLLCVVRGLETL